ncbi:MAG: hypothetical protein A2X25_06030 [Chloroflexi bacterium GWB2_49_20]|nr:MAG: hypothetical protein A2X25_06030 [Chloroflexi bacterium GWB2_49_20]OGN77177.1 MAG: hypothetical protein A2X26_07030 [Chloroflexi bacterium GWC2_49_37]OGN83903.1 MAG: hypothetical protein A2X27_02635 [Chloroflexi bacterium GWD2_49_16]
MKYKSIASITAILTFINAILFLALPALTMSMFGRTLSTTGIMNTRISGACALGLSLVLWQLKDLPPSRMQTAISKSLLLTMIVLVIIDLHGILTGAVNQFGWIIFFVDILMVAGFLSVVFTGTINN